MYLPGWGSHSLQVHNSPITDCPPSLSTEPRGMLTKTSGVLNLSQDELAHNMDLVQINGLVICSYLYILNKCIFFNLLIIICVGQG